MFNLEYLAELAQTHRSKLGVRVEEFTLGGKLFAFNEGPRVMGVVNMSADSWYRESVCLSAEAAIQRGRVLTAQGADIIDIGAESTLANAAVQDASEQNRRLLPVVRELRASGCLVSVETYQPEVARQALEAGANVINLTGADTTGDIFRAVAAHEAAVILCYVQGANVRAVGDFDFSADPIATMRDYFERAIEQARSAGVTRIFIDPGLGFYYRNLQDSGTRIRHQMTVFAHTFRLRELGYPTCHALPHAFECFGEEVRCAEPFFAVLAALGKTDLFRTHEVPRIKAVLNTMKLF